MTNNTHAKKTIIYIGGYQSGGHKTSILRKIIDHEIINFLPDYDTETPNNIQNKIITAIENAISKGHWVEIIGSSTGGMTALLLFSKYNLPMYLINPLLAKEQFLDNNHPVGPMLKSASEILLKQEYLNNKINIFLGEKDELLNPNFTKTFANKKNIKIINFEGYHAGTESLEMISNLINKKPI